MNTFEWEQSVDSPVDQPSYDKSVARAMPLPLIERMVERIELPSAGRFSNAEAVINRVVEVTESNQTNERTLERKHEVKDFAAKETQKQQFATRISEILGTQPALHGSYDSNQEYARNQTTKPSIFKRLTATNSLYGYAIRYGFFSALLALLSAVIIVTLFT